MGTLLWWCLIVTRCTWCGVFDKRGWRAAVGCWNLTDIVMVVWTLLESYSSSWCLTARWWFSTQSAGVHFRSSIVIQETRLIQMWLRLLLHSTVIASWLRWGVHEDTSLLPIHCIHALEDRLFLNLRSALYKQSRSLRGPRRLRSQCLSSRGTLVLLLTSCRFVARTGPLAARN